MAPRAYYLDFVTIPLAIALVVATEYARGRIGWGWMGHAVAGVTLFTFVEYWVHRVLLHKVFWSSHHQRHHSHPVEYVTFSAWFTPAVIVASSFVVAAWGVNGGLLAGWFVGILWFYAWHHVLHHWDLNAIVFVYKGDGASNAWERETPEPTPMFKHPWLRAYAEWHELHHKDLPFNYGITHPLWDLVFGTYCTTEAGQRILRANAIKFKRRMD